MATPQELQQTIKDEKAKAARLRAEAMDITSRSTTPELSAGDAERVDRLFRGIEAAEAKVTEADDAWRAAILSTHQSARAAGRGLEGEHVYATRSSGGTSLRDEAMRTVDSAYRSKKLPEHAAATVEGLVSGGEQAGRDLSARWAIATGSDAYMRAFTKVLTDPQRAHLLMTAEEHEAYGAVQDIRRAMSTGAGAGAEMLPLILDPAIHLTSDSSTNPLRKLARVVQTSASSYRLVTSAGVTAEWKAEGAQAADATPTLADLDIPVHLGDAYVPFSYEVLMDALDFANQLSRLLNDAADQLQANAFMNGTGSGQPTGLVTALPSGSKLASATADAIVASDVVKVQNGLPPRFQPRAQWAASLTTINLIRGMETTNGALRFPELANGNLLGRAMNEASLLNAPGDTSSAGNDNVLLYGDFSEFVIADRIGSQIELVQNVFGANQRPTGQRGALLWFRTGSNVAVTNAFRLLTA